MSLPAGKYYLAFEHGAGQESASKHVQLTYRVTGVHVPSLAIGLGLVAFGIALAGLGLRSKRRTVAAPQPPATSDVVLFEDASRRP